jgi:hypothetical protein
MHKVVFGDAFIADGQDDVGPLFESYANGDAELANGLAKVSQASADYIPADVGRCAAEGSKARSVLNRAKSIDSR